MSLVCIVRRHSAASNVISNAGHNFTRCTRCGADLLERDGVWALAPKGFRIVWKVSSASSPLPVTGSPTEADRALPTAANDGEPYSKSDCLGAQPEAASFIDRRARVDRRVSSCGNLPIFLNGRDRRQLNDRRAVFGNKKTYAEEIQLDLAI